MLGPAAAAAVVAAAAAVVAAGGQRGHGPGANGSGHEAPDAEVKDAVTGLAYTGSVRVKEWVSERETVEKETGLGVRERVCFRF